MYAPIATQSRPGSAPYSGERLVNYFARPASGLSPAVLLSRGGLSAHVAVSGVTRALLSAHGYIYAAAGGRLYRISGGVATDLGAISDGITTMAANATKLAIVAGGVYYAWDGTTLSSPATGAVTDPTSVASMNSYFVVSGSSGGRGDAITWSRLDDPTTFDGLDFAFAEAQPDAAVSVLADHNELWVFGTSTVQPFYVSDSEQVFLPNQGALIEHGAQANTMAKADNAVFWVTPEGKVARSLGSGPQWISTPEVQDEISRSVVTGGFTFSERGHEFYAVSLHGKPTLVYDIVTGLWHERATGLEYAPWAAGCAVLHEGTWYFGCEGFVATASADTFTDLGGAMVSEVISPLHAQRGELFRVARLHVDFSGGAVDIDRTPEAMLQTSRDGQTWGREMWRPLADFGRYKRRALWNALGQFRQGSIRIRVTDPVPRDLVGVTVSYA